MSTTQQSKTLEQRLRRFSHFGLTPSVKECVSRLSLYTARDDEALPRYGVISEPFRFVEQVDAQSSQAWAVATDGRVFVAIKTESRLKAHEHEKLNAWLAAHLRPSDAFEMRELDFTDLARRVGRAHDDQLIDCGHDAERMMACDFCNETGKREHVAQRPTWLRMTNRRGEVSALLDCELVARCLLALPLEARLRVALHADEPLAYFFTERAIACISKMVEKEVLKNKSPRSIPMIEL